MRSDKGTADVRSETGTAHVRSKSGTAHVRSETSKGAYRTLCPAPRCLEGGSSPYVHSTVLGLR